MSMSHDGSCHFIRLLNSALKLYGQIFPSYFVICHLQHIDRAPKIFAHLLKRNLQLEISVGRTAPAK